MKNLNTIIKLTCLVMFCMMSTMAFSQSNNERVIFRKGDKVVNAYDGSLQSIGVILNTSNQATIDKHTTKLRDALQEVTGTAVSANDLDTMLEVTQNNLTFWLDAYDQLKVTNHDNNLYVVRSIIANLKSKL